MRNPFAIKASSPVERMIRTLALLCVILLVIWAFWLNNQRLVDRMNQEQGFWDETGQMSKEDAGFAEDFISALKEEQGIEAFVHVRKGEVEPPSGLGGKAFFLGISPSREEVVVRLPASMDAPEDEALADYLEREHFKSNWDRWQRGLKTALVMVWERLTRTGPAVSRYVEDGSGLLDRDTLLALDRFGRDLADTYGQTLLVRLAPEVDGGHGLDPTVLYIGLWPETGAAALRFPAMLEKALGQDLQRELLTDVLQPSLAGDHWKAGLKTVLERIWMELDGKERNW